MSWAGHLLAHDQEETWRDDVSSFDEGAAALVAAKDPALVIFAIDDDGQPTGAELRWVPLDKTWSGQRLEEVGGQLVRRKHPQNALTQDAVKAFDDRFRGKIKEAYPGALMEPCWPTDAGDALREAYPKGLPNGDQQTAIADALGDRAGHALESLAIRLAGGPTLTAEQAVAELTRIANGLLSGELANTTVMEPRV